MFLLVAKMVTQARQPCKQKSGWWQSSLLARFTEREIPDMKDETEPERVP
jgi:hypothetical protein